MATKSKTQAYWELSLLTIRRHSISRFVTEPLLHFAVPGAAIFAALNVVSAEKPSDSAAIVVTPDKIEILLKILTRSWQRPPSTEESNGLIQDYIREEVAVREAVALKQDSGWTYGMLANHLWPFAGNDGRSDVSAMVI